MLADTVLMAACGTQGRRRLAEGLLVVVFDPRTTPAQRTAAVKHLGGTVLSRPGAADVESYVQVPAGVDEQQLADQLIRLDQVRTVTAAECPRPLPKTTNDTSRSR